MTSGLQLITSPSLPSALGKGADQRHIGAAVRAADQVGF